MHNTSATIAERSGTNPDFSLPDGTLEEPGKGGAKAPPFQNRGERSRLRESPTNRTALSVASRFYGVTTIPRQTARITITSEANKRTARSFGPRRRGSSTPEIEVPEGCPVEVILSQRFAPCLTQGEAEPLLNSRVFAWGDTSATRATWRFEFIEVAHFTGWSSTFAGNRPADWQFPLQCQRQVEDPGF